MSKPKKRTFLGFDTCLAMLRSRDAETQEEGYYALLPHIGEYIEPLEAALRSETNPYIQGWILELLGVARNPSLFPVLVEYFFSPNQSVKEWARLGLAELRKTRDGRRVLWEAYLYGVQLPLDMSSENARTLQEYLASLTQDL